MHKLAELCVRRPVSATMLVLSMVVLGANSFNHLGVDLFPKVDFPVTTVTTTLQGASPEEIETTVTQKIEETVNTISGIDELRSVSAEGVSQVFIRFELEKDADIAAQEVRDKVNGILRDLPEDIDPPVVEKFDPDASPVMSVAVSANRDLRETTKIVQDLIKENIETVSGVGQVRFIGDRTRQIQVWLDPQRLAAYDITIDQVRAALRAQNVEIPGGRVDQGARELTLRTLGRITKPSDFEDLVVTTVGGAPVCIRDLGYVEDGVEEPRTQARLNDKPAVVLEVRKQSGTNTLEVIRGIKQRLAEIEPVLPKDFNVQVVRDQATFIEASFEAVVEHLILGGILAALVVLLFIRNLRATIIAAVAIPTSVISTFMLIDAKDFTLNQITLLALTLLVGVVIDDAIVVLENIFRFREEKKMDSKTAAIEAARDIGLAVVATTFSLMIIFLPIAFMGGIPGRFMTSFGWTAAFAIGFSLIVSFTLTPMLASRYLKLGDGGGQATRDTVLFRLLDRRYRRMLVWSMAHRRTIVAGTAVVALANFPLFLLLGKSFLPPEDRSQIDIAVRAPTGSSLAGTDRLMRELEREVQRLPHIKYVLTTIGADAQTRVERGSIFVEFVPIEERDLSQQELMEMARQRLARFRDVRISVQEAAVIAGGGFANVDIQFYVLGSDIEKLGAFSNKIVEELQKSNVVTDVDTSYEPGKPEVRAHINRKKAADLGVNVFSIATALRTLVGGDEQVTTYREGDDRYDVMLRAQRKYRTTMEGLKTLYVPSQHLGNIELANVVRLDEGTGPSQIDRLSRQRQISILGNVVRGQSESAAHAKLDEIVAGLDLPAGYQTGLIGRGRELGRTAERFFVAFVLSIIFMYMVLAALFESFVDPITILLSLPLAVPFGLLSLFITGQNYSVIFGSLGVLILFGIVKKNAILQIDHIKALRREGIERGEAILRGCRDRLRPILMTTTSLVAGMIPVALGTGPGSGARRGVAIIVVFGQTLCLLLTLLVTPVFYSLFDDLLVWLESLKWREAALAQTHRWEEAVQRLPGWLAFRHRH